MLTNEVVDVIIVFPVSLDTPTADMLIIRLPHDSTLAVTRSVSPPNIALIKFVVMVIVGGIISPPHSPKTSIP